MGVLQQGRQQMLQRRRPGYGQMGFQRSMYDGRTGPQQQGGMSYLDPYHRSMQGYGPPMRQDDWQQMGVQPQQEQGNFGNWQAAVKPQPQPAQVQLGTAMGNAVQNSQFGEKQRTGAGLTVADLGRLAADQEKLRQAQGQQGQMDPHQSYLDGVNKAHQMWLKNQGGAAYMGGGQSQQGGFGRGEQMQVGPQGGGGQDAMGQARQNWLQQAGGMGGQHMGGMGGSSYGQGGANLGQQGGGMGNFMSQQQPWMGNAGNNLMSQMQGGQQGYDPFAEAPQQDSFSAAGQGQDQAGTFSPNGAGPWGSPYSNSDPGSQGAYSGSGSSQQGGNYNDPYTGQNYLSGIQGIPNYNTPDPYTMQNPSGAWDIGQMAQQPGGTQNPAYNDVSQYGGQYDLNNQFDPTANLGQYNTAANNQGNFGAYNSQGDTAMQGNNPNTQVQGNFNWQNQGDQINQGSITGQNFGDLYNRINQTVGGGQGVQGPGALNQEGFDTSAAGNNAAYAGFLDSSNKAADAMKQQEQMQAEQEAGAMGLKGSASLLRQYGDIDAKAAQTKFQAQQTVLQNQMQSWNNAISSVRDTNLQAYLQQNQGALQSLTFRQQANLQLALQNGDTSAALDQIRLSGALGQTQQQNALAAQFQSQKNDLVGSLQQQGNTIQAQKFSQMSSQDFQSLTNTANQKFNTFQTLNADEIASKMADKGFAQQMVGIANQAHLTAGVNWSATQAADYYQQAREKTAMGAQLNQNEFTAFMSDKQNAAAMQNITTQIGGQLNLAGLNISAQKAQQLQGQYFQTVMTESPAQAEAFRLNTIQQNGGKLSPEETQRLSDINAYNGLQNLKAKGYTLTPDEQNQLQNYTQQFGGGGAWGQADWVSQQNFNRAMGMSVMGGYMATENGYNAMNDSGYNFNAADMNAMANGNYDFSNVGSKKEPMVYDLMQGHSVPSSQYGRA